MLQASVPVTIAAEIHVDSVFYGGPGQERVQRWRSTVRIGREWVWSSREGEFKSEAEALRVARREARRAARTMRDHTEERVERAR